MKDAKFMSAREKELVLRAWEKFLRNGLKATGFTVRLYEHLVQHCQFIANFNRQGFYQTYFANPKNTIKFFKQFDTDFGCISIEYRMLWVDNAEYGDINRAMCDAFDRVKAEIYQTLKERATANDLALASGLAKMHGYILVPGKDAVVARSTEA